MCLRLRPKKQTAMGFIPILIALAAIMIPLSIDGFTPGLTLFTREGYFGKASHPAARSTFVHDRNLARIVLAQEKNDGVSPAKQVETLLKNAGDRSDPGIQKIELSAKNIADMIDETFVKGCMDLARGYVDVLKLMIVSTKAAYSLGINFNALTDTLSAKKASAANRELMKEEIELRSSWLSAIYLTLNRISYQNVMIEPSEVHSGDSILSGISSQNKDYYDIIIEEIIDSGDGISVSNLSVDRFLHFSDSETDPMQKAIVSQSIRVIILTLLVIEEETKCIPATPRPPIPGAN
jgi:hypothetical protein